MPFLIDGHNLSAKTPGLSLDQIDDELALVSLLEVYFRRIRKQAEVYFDRAAFGKRNTVRRAFVVAHFIPAPGDADHAIIKRMDELGGDIHNYTIITSDRWISDQAVRRGAQVLSSEAFSRQLVSDNSGKPGSPNGQDPDLDYWLQAFSQRPK